MEHKRVLLEGIEVTIAGRPGDSYYDHLGEADDNSLLADVVRLLPADATIFDVGANMGVTAAMMAARLPSARIYCFEPGPEPFEFLTETVRLNGFARVHPLKKALAMEPGRMSFLENKQSAGASHLVTQQTLGGGNEVVSVSTVDLEMEALGLDRLDLIKIDVEGFEIDVIAGARKTLASHRPHVVLEFNSFTMMAFRDVYPRAFLERLIADFPYVYQRQRSSGHLERVFTAAEQLRFIHDNLVHHGCVDDLLCCWAPLSHPG